MNVTSGLPEELDRWKGVLSKMGRVEMWVDVQGMRSTKLLSVL